MTLPDTQMSISLRDYFAGQALTGLVNREQPDSPDNIARMAYAVADAMLIAAEPPQTPPEPLP